MLTDHGNVHTFEVAHHRHVDQQMKEPKVHREPQPDLLDRRCERSLRESEALLYGARAVLEESDFMSAARRIFDICCDLTGASSGYVALLDVDGINNDVLFLESGGRECTVDPDLLMPVRGMRAERQRQPRAR